MPADLTPLERLAVENARREFPVPSPREIVAHADRDIAMAVLDLNVAINQTADIAELLRLREHIVSRAAELNTLTYCALQRADALLRARGVE